jgi:hypothetical protein
LYRPVGARIGTDLNAECHVDLSQQRGCAFCFQQQSVAKLDNSPDADAETMGEEM